jgi:hypothetical protein
MRGLVIVAAVVAVVSSAGVAHAQSTASAQSLLYPPGARAGGMGRAFTAVASDPTAAWWNPGGVAFTQERGATLMHTKLVPDLADDVYYEHLAYGQPLEGVGGIGANIIYLSYGKSVAVGEDEVVKGEFSSYEIAGTGAIGFKVNPNLGLGAALKFVYVYLAPAWATEDNRQGSGSSFAVDLGVLYRIPSPFLATDEVHLAGVITNIGPDITFIDAGQSSPLGHIVKLGFMYQVFDTGTYAFRTAYDFNQPVIITEEGKGFFERLADFKRPLFGSREEPIQHFGGELTYEQGNIRGAVRAGYVYDPEGTIEDWTFGLGFGLGRFQVDWAMVPQSVFLEDNVQHFSVTAEF